MNRANAPFQVIDAEFMGDELWTRNEITVFALGIIPTPGG